MKTTQEKDKRIETVLEYAYKNKFGYMRDLEKLNEPEIVTELCMLGFLKPGYAIGGKTYVITPTGIRYYCLVKSARPTMLYRLLHWGLGK